MKLHELMLQRGETDVWLTPPAIVEALGPFDLCPAAAVGSPFRYAAEHYTVEDDGLVLEWAGRVWLNPPYERGLIAKFTRRMVDHDHGTMLVFPRTETRWFQLAARHCSAMLLRTPRIAFCRLDGIPASGKFLGSVFFAFGRYDAGKLMRAHEESDLFKGVLFS